MVQHWLALDCSAFSISYGTGRFVSLRFMAQ